MSERWPAPRDVCECGDYRSQHAGPEHRGSCLVCRDGDPPPDGPDGCQRYRYSAVCTNLEAVLTRIVER